MAALSAYDASRSSPIAARKPASSSFWPWAEPTAKSAAKNGTNHCLPMGKSCSLLIVLPRALLGHLVVGAAIERHPVGFDILAARQEIGPGVPRHQSGGFPNHVELTVRLHFADQHRLGDVMVRQNLRLSTRQVGGLQPRQRCDHFVHL